MDQATPTNAGDLVALAAAGDQAAVSRLMIDLYPKLAARVEQRLPADLKAVIAAEDILQEALADAFVRIGTFRPEGEDSFYRWIVSIAENRLIDAVRSQRAAKRGGEWNRLSAGAFGRSSIACLVDLLAASDHTPSQSVGTHEAAAAVQVALAGLRQEYREALSLRYLQGLPVAEVAARLGKTESAVHKLCSRGLQGLRESMGEAAKYLSRR